MGVLSEYYICLCNTCIASTSSQKRALDSLGTGIAGSCELPCRCWDKKYFQTLSHLSSPKVPHFYYYKYFTIPLFKLHKTTWPIKFYKINIQLWKLITNNIFCLFALSQGLMYPRMTSSSSWAKAGLQLLIFQLLLLQCYDYRHVSQLWIYTHEKMV